MKPSKRFRDLPHAFNDFFPSFNDFFSWNDLKKSKLSLEIPPVNIRQDDKLYSIELATPGFDKKDVKIDVKDGVITISSDKKTETKEEKEDYSRVEYDYRSFSRSFTLPNDAVEKDIKASMENGQLTIEIPKSANDTQLENRQITIS